ncbi:MULTISPECIES: six-hairpin glycosidase [unclassified Mucilaginibacter]|uniref:six-hairpin glycosidase n=1 Tax=unclassified Mucilaginibacter TaxID=2617802 RepID=UPI000884D122|nr:six-hairpin glycosidase [Mucilaginibacter sp. OK268]SDP11774.1 BNR repeat-like domain-containing protein [Mucilaginibacter sp. OK268]
MNKFIIILFFISMAGIAKAQDIVHYSGNTVANVDYHHGQLTPVIGVHSKQIFRANRKHPELADGYGFTYNHAPMLAYWNNTFYVEYLSDKVGESVPPGQTLLITSKDGETWSKPTVVFPQYKIPDGTTKEGYPGVAKDLYSVMHQRMGYYTSKSKRLLVLGFYGICLDGHDDPNDGLGIGRVVREVLPNGKFGPIYFIHYNPKWNEKNTSFPFYKTSKDKGFVQACDELMANPLMMMQWVEETNKKDPLIPLHKDYKAFNFYHLPDGRVVGLWKYALTAISTDNGKTWPTNASRAPRFVNANAKIWGQRTSDGKYVTVYNPSEFRWPLALSVSKDGLDYTNLLLVNGEITTMRYGGAYKSYGPQYVRGIEEGNGTPPDGKLWVTYSMNKEDIWVSSIPVPITEKADAHANEVFNQLPAGKELEKWNTYSPQWAPADIDKTPDGERALTLKDSDPFDFAKAERVVPVSKKLMTDFTITAGQNNTGMLDIEFQDEKGTAAIRLTLDSAGQFRTKAGYRNKNFMKYEGDTQFHVVIKLNTDTRFYTVNVNGKDVLTGLFFAPVLSVNRVVFRTGDIRRFPDADTPTDQDYDRPNAGETAKQAVFYIKSFKTSNY